MATPRIFISSTCYDFQEIRHQLRRYIQDMGYEPVMSDFGDIFYDLGQHVQDACKNEIAKSNIFVLVIGNNYGTIYHKRSDNNEHPDSVTLQEFKKAIEINIPKYIFINKFVQYDFENYVHSFRKYVEKYFSENEVQDENVEKMKFKLKEQFDISYPFPQENYKYVFYFLDILYSLEINNALYSFETFEDIRETLKKQWAGFFYESLIKEKTVSIEKIEILEKKLNKIESHLRAIAEKSNKTHDKNKITIDIEKLSSDLDIENLDELQEKINHLLNGILLDSYGRPRLIIKKEFDNQISSSWLSSLVGFDKIRNN